MNVDSVDEICVRKFLFLCVDQGTETSAHIVTFMSRFVSLQKFLLVILGLSRVNQLLCKSRTATTTK